MIVIDNNVLVQLLTDKQASDKLSCYLQQENCTLILPTPVLAEFLAHDHNKRRTSHLITPNSCLSIAPFDHIAAMICGELGDMLDKTKANKPKQKVKVDLQILSIAISTRAKSILTEDTDIIKIIKALDLKIKVITLTNTPSDMPLFD